MRAQVELETDPGALATVEREVLFLAEAHPLLREFLPWHMRPPVSSASELERRNDLIKVSITERVPDWGESRRYIRLHDIVSHHRGSGIGTAALWELCAYADSAGLVITADFVPGFDLDAARIARLAGWYYRHGFRQRGREPESWQRPAPMSREPKPHRGEDTGK